MIELFDRNAVNLQYLTRPKLTVFRLIFTPGCSVSWVSSLFANHVCPEWVFVCLLSPSNCVRYRIYRIFSPFFPLTFFVSCFCRESDDILHRLASWTWDEISHPFCSDQNTHQCWMQNLSCLKPFLLMVLLLQPNIATFLPSSRTLLNALHRGFWCALKHRDSHFSISCIPWLTRKNNHFSRVNEISPIITKFAPSILSIWLLSFSLVAVARRRFIDGRQSRRKKYGSQRSLNSPAVQNSGKRRFYTS